MQGDMPATRLQRAGPAPEGSRGPEPTPSRNCILFKFQVALPQCPAPHGRVRKSRSSVARESADPRAGRAGIGRPQGRWRL